MSSPNLLAGPPPVLLPVLHPEAVARLAAGEHPAEVAALEPTCLEAWAGLAERAFTGSGTAAAVAAYAYARTGYHRGLDQLRRGGWKGFGPVPWSHQGNRGVLRCVAALSRAAGLIGETDEQLRCRDLLRDCDPAAERELLGG